METIILSSIGISELKAIIQESVELALKKEQPAKEAKNDNCNLDEAVEITGLQKSAIYKLTMKKYRENVSNPLPFGKAGKFLSFKRSELLSWCEQRLIYPDDRSGVALTLSKSATRKR